MSPSSGAMPKARDRRFMEEAYAARPVVNVPFREVSAKIESFNYQRQ